MLKPRPDLATSESNRLSYDSIVDKGQDWLTRGIRSECTGLVIAPENFVDPETGKRYFTFEEALRLEVSVKIPFGWRMPTKNEVKNLILELGVNPEDSELDSELLLDRFQAQLWGWVDAMDMLADGKSPPIPAHGSNDICCFWTRTMTPERDYPLRHWTEYHPLLREYSYAFYASRPGPFGVRPFARTHGLPIRFVCKL